MSSETLHEDPEQIGPRVIDRHRAITSLMEELEAVDWYDQRVAATDDEELKAVLAHNRAEEKAAPPAPVASEGHLGIGDLRGDNSNEPAAPASRRAANER